MQNPDQEFDTLGQITQHIVQVHHQYLWREMAPLQSLVRHVASLHGSRDERLHAVQRLFSALVEDLGWHLRREEDIVFPRIHLLETGGELGPEDEQTIEQALHPMVFEHRGAEEALAELRLLTQDYRVPEFASDPYRSMLRQLEFFEMDMVEHMRLEDEVLFPRCLELEKTKRSQA